MWERIFLALMTTILLVMQSKSNSEWVRDLPRSDAQLSVRPHDELTHDPQGKTQAKKQWQQAF